LGTWGKVPAWDRIPNCAEKGKSRENGKRKRKKKKKPKLKETICFFGKAFFFKERF
jgi:hypothetical protein